MRVQANIETKTGDLRTFLVPIESHKSIKKQVISFVEDNLKMKFLDGFIIKEIMAL